MKSLENEKLVANDIFGFFENYKNGKCSYDRALEEAAKVILAADKKRLIVGYVSSGSVEKVLNELFKTKKINSEKSYIYDCQIHQNEMDLAERMLRSIP